MKFLVCYDVLVLKYKVRSQILSELQINFYNQQRQNKEDLCFNGQIAWLNVYQNMTKIQINRIPSSQINVISFQNLMSNWRSCTDSKSSEEATVMLRNVSWRNELTFILSYQSFQSQEQKYKYFWLEVIPLSDKLVTLIQGVS